MTTDRIRALANRHASDAVMISITVTAFTLQSGASYGRIVRGIVAIAAGLTAVSIVESIHRIAHLVRRGRTEAVTVPEGWEIRVSPARRRFGYVAEGHYLGYAPEPDQHVITVWGWTHGAAAVQCKDFIWLEESEHSGEVTRMEASA